MQRSREPIEPQQCRCRQRCSREPDGDRRHRTSWRPGGCPQRQQEEAGEQSDEQGAKSSAAVVAPSENACCDKRDGYTPHRNCRGPRSGFAFGCCPRRRDVRGSAGRALGWIIGPGRSHVWIVGHEGQSWPSRTGRARTLEIQPVSRYAVVEEVAVTRRPIRPRPRPPGTPPPKQRGGETRGRALSHRTSP